MHTKIFTAHSAEQTEQLGLALGNNLRGGEIIDLVSDLGGGKTTFARGLVKGAGSNDKVASPSFTLSKIYKTDNLELHHFDFYRLQEPGIMGYELHDLLGDPKVVVIVEWADVVRHILPDERISIVIEKGEESRTLKLQYPEILSYIAEDL